MTYILSMPIRRFAALGILAAVLLLVWQLAISPLSDLLEKAGDATTANRLFVEYKKTIDEKPKWDELLRQAKHPPYADLFIEGADPDLAVAKLQQQIKQITETSHGTIKSIQVLPTTKDHDLERVGVRVNFSVPLDQMTHVFEKYDKNRPYVFTDNLLITTHENAPNISTGPILLVNCDLYSYLQPIAP